MPVNLLFLWPPLFILAGMGIDQLMTVVKLPMLKTALLIIVTLPGIYACSHLYPYEYIYYNSLIGSIRGANHKFELDYWGISFQESIQYINKKAEPGTTIVVFIGNRQVVKEYARPDLSIGFTHDLRKSQDQPYYMLSSTRANQDLAYCQNINTVFEVQRDGALLSYIKRIDPGKFVTNKDARF